MNLWVWPCDSKVVGIGYFVVSFFGGILGFAFSLILSVELSVPFSLMEENFYYVSVTSHGLLMLFYFLTTLASGFSNYLIPQMCFLKDMYYGSVNVFTLGLVIYSLGFVMLSLTLGEGAMTGWTLYTPLSGKEFSPDSSMDLLMMGVHMFTLASILGSWNMLVTVGSQYYLFESFFDMPPLMWGFLVTSVLVILCMPSLSCVLTFLLLDSGFGSHIFDVEFGGDPVLFQTMFWYFGHPEVYMLILPVFGVVTQVLEGKGFIYNSEGIMCSMVALGLLSLLVFGHHMTTVGWGVDVSSFFMSSTMSMSIPTGVKVFSWLFDLYFWSKEVKFHILFVMLFIIHFSSGGMTGFFLSNSSLDFFLHDTWFVVGHLHMVLAVSSFFGFMSGLVWLFGEEFFNTEEFQLLGVLMCVLSFLFFNLLFTPFHIAGVLGLHSSVTCYPMEMFLLFYLESVFFMGIFMTMFLMAVFMVMSWSVKDSK